MSKVIFSDIKKGNRIIISDYVNQVITIHSVYMCYNAVKRHSEKVCNINIQTLHEVLLEKNGYGQMLGVPMKDIVNSINSADKYKIK